MNSPPPDGSSFDSDENHPGWTPFRPLIFGEALFDHFPDGKRVLGGAPFNVAWHLKGFKAQPLLVSSVGEDLEGDTILEKMNAWGMEGEGVQRHPDRPTGRVSAVLEAGEPRYDIEPSQAYDAVFRENLPETSRLVRSQILYHGTLALRESTSEQTLTFLRRELRVPTFVDVNLRSPWWNRERVLDHLQKAHWVKMSREETGLLSARSVASDGEMESAGWFLRDELEIETLIVTSGARGAVALSPLGTHWQKARALLNGVDPVGAGDGFSAVLAMAIHGRWPLPVALERAADFAADICEIRGAIPEGPGLYSRHLERWNHAS